MNTDKSGRIDYKEFIAATLDEKIYLKEQILYEVIKNVNKDGSGTITNEELKKILKLEDNNPESEAKVKEIIKKIDKNGDNQIDYNEFWI